MTTITIPLDVAEAASNALGNFVMDHGWSDSDMQAMDNLDAYIARHKANQSALSAPVTAPEQPSWHDAPTVPGAWICADKEHVKRTHTITPGILPVISKFGDRWYGPIPEDKQ